MDVFNLGSDIKGSGTRPQECDYDTIGETEGRRGGGGTDRQMNMYRYADR